MTLALSPNGATILLGVVTAACLDGVTTRDERDQLTASLATYWSIAREAPRGQAPMTPSDVRAIDILVNTLIAHLQGSFAL